MDGGILVGIMALAAVWIYSNAKVQTAALQSNLLSPQGLAGAGVGVGAASAGLGSLVNSLSGLFNGGHGGGGGYTGGNAFTDGIAGSNTGGGPLGGQSGILGGGSSDDSGSLIGLGDFGNDNNNPGAGFMSPGGSDGGDTGTFYA